MLATKASAKSNKPSTMRDEIIVRIRERQTQNLDPRGLRRGDRQNLAELQANAKTDALSMLNAAPRNKVDKLMLKMKKLRTPSACMYGVLRTSPRRSHPERFQCIAGMTEHESTAKHWGLISQSSQKRASQRKAESSANLA